MEKRLLLVSAVVLPVLMILTFAFLYIYPDYHAMSLLQEEMEYEEAVQNAIEAAHAQNLQELFDETEELEACIRIEIPNGVDLTTVAVSNDYLTQEVTVRFPTDCQDFFEDYHVRGSSQYISSIDYDLNSGIGTLSLGLSQLYEISYVLEDQALYLDFIDPHDIYDCVVVVDAGHGGRAVGATKDGVCEKDIDLAIVLALRDLVEESGENIGLYFTRTDDSNPSLDERVSMANAAQADLFISVHNNASRSGRFSNLNGTQVLYSESDTEYYSSELLAQICLEEVTRTLGSRNIGLLKGDEIYIIRNSEVPVALIEVGFLTNRDELANLQDPDYQMLAAEGIFNAIKQAIAEGF